MPDDLIAAIQQQERALVLPAFDEDTAFAIGCALRDRARAIAAPVSIEIRATSRRFFFATLPGATPNNEEWGRRKGNTVLRTWKSSMRVGLELKRSGRVQWPDAGLAYEDFVDHGGGFPVTVGGMGVVAAIAVSGLPSIEDHQLAAATLAAHLGIAEIPLPQPD
ncbi:heme-degrading domain-containing protein [Sagittula stellata]|uniref:Uncharacterized protein n=1 Tax=Sagittula stellata (strain ATCC 700073 / DSM 11524 / E-37) TaxID=388399 RepID=A3KAR0_SAGS3|nr:heme-degrading domain-containing protein [Sagittula stellata]EBA05706.1 hypothetical protein SSE37_18297 [Sagittula stellata E-37]